ncbi:hypothetical protein GQ42DRAFT_118136 [Ramicandelaber brevisporus]|nr:hypothetical protein GQ42DRAFT_118136 [Ramicandelaber brevisporus]
MTQFKVAVVTVSDTVSRGETVDRTGPALCTLFTNHTSKAGSNEWLVSDTAAVPDHRDSITSQVRQFTSPQSHGSTVDLLILAGGTGLSPTDVTYETLLPLLERQCPGIQIAMMVESLKVTPMAALGRPLCGIIQSTLVIATPGSPKGAVENISAVIGVLPHAIKLIKGENSRRLHSVKDTVISSNADNQQQQQQQQQQQLQQVPIIGINVTDRHRKSPYPMVPVDDATHIIDECTKVLPTAEVGLNSSILGSVLAEDVFSPTNLPAVRTSIVDGYAVMEPVVKTSQFNVIDTASVATVSNKSILLEPGSVQRVNTGGRVPDNAVAVVMVEDTTLIESSDDGKHERKIQVSISSPAAAYTDGMNIRDIGCDIALGAKIASKGTIVDAASGLIGLLASVGIQKVKVHSRPRAGVLSTGDEVLDLSQSASTNLVDAIKAGGVVDTNRPTLLAAITALGYEAVDLGIVRDDPSAIEAAIRDSLDKVDVVFTTGGVSMGERDHIKPILEHKLNAKVHFGRVQMKPGKPTTFATIPWHAKSDQGGHVHKLVFALPGNPVSALTAFHIFAAPALRKLAGVSDYANCEVQAVLTHDVQLDPRPEFMRAIVTAKVSSHGYKLEAKVTSGNQASSRMLSMQDANALLKVQARSNTKRTIAAGSTIDAILLGDVKWA